MQTLRTSLMLTRLVMAWFMLTFGVAVASPIIAPHTLVMLCSQDGARSIVIDADGKIATTKDHTLDCAFCIPAAAPPPSVSVLPPATNSVRHVEAHFTSAPAQAAAGAPPPPRGPPA